MTTPRFATVRRTVVPAFALTALPAALALAFTPAAEGAPAVPPAQTIGTIEAILGGEARTWYVVSGEAGGRPQPGSFWMELGEGEVMGVVGGFDTEDLDFSSIEMEGGMPLSLGSYEGSMISLGFPIPEGDGTGSWGTDDGDASLTYLVEAQALDYASALMLAGTIETTRVETGSTCRFEGRFSGTLRRMGEDDEGIDVAGGMFEVEGCQRLEVGGGP